MYLPEIDCFLMNPVCDRLLTIIFMIFSSIVHSEFTIKHPEGVGGLDLFRNDFIWLTFFRFKFLWDTVMFYWILTSCSKNSISISDIVLGGWSRLSSWTDFGLRCHVTRISMGRLLNSIISPAGPIFLTSMTSQPVYVTLTSYAIIRKEFVEENPHFFIFSSMLEHTFW